MVRKILLLAVLVVFVFSFSGCATSRNNELLNQGQKNKVISLEEIIQQKDEEINSLRDSLARTQEQKETVEKTGEVKERPSIKQIQTALKNAGYYQGSIDGKMGKNTRQAIKDFQKANNLSADGKVGKKTWAALKDYLEKKVK